MLSINIMAVLGFGSIHYNRKKLWNEHQYHNMETLYHVVCCNTISFTKGHWCHQTLQKMHWHIHTHICLN